MAQGIDPYIEATGLWPDFHLRFLNYWCEALAQVLPRQYDVRMDERVNVVELSANTLKRIEPDLAITRAEAKRAATATTGVIATLEPVTVPLLIQEERREVYIEVIRRPHRTLVAVLELLSPSNKTDPDSVAYLAKRDALLHQPVHLVELDLLKGGRRLPLGADYPAGDFFALVSRSDRRPNCQVYAWPAPDPLPTIPIPLHGSDSDYAVNLESVFQTAFAKGRYADSEDYTAFWRSRR